ncbi:lipoyl(octanoyl) transferase LipB [Kamptonema cortianum]|nr:lipoyl(octanoyl) transferase LipB [Geitlerinema splendidum]MDK3162283.1 lipoyl(octanoyl) transferase LipB [Kamptonema cortianum]
MKARFRDLGRLEYKAAWDEQLLEHQLVVSGGPDTLIFVEHPPVLTLGASFDAKNLLLSEEDYASRGISLERTDRGGDVTYHGPGQLVIYPIFNVSRHGRDLHKWMRDLEETMILTCQRLGVEANREPEVNTGAWVNGKKIAAIGVKVRKWVSLHGVALNCDLDLSVFNLFVPCGVRTHGVTSLSHVLGKEFTIDEAKSIVRESFSEVFGLTFDE